jgi:hypothetical protein
MKSLGFWIVLGFLSLVLFLAGMFLYVGWDPGENDPNYAMTGAGYIAMTMGIAVTVLLGVGLMTLVFYSSRHDQD